MIHIEKRDFQSNRFWRIVMQVCRAMVDNNNKNSTVNHNGRRLIHGDQGTPICDACCKGDMCNSKDCFDLKRSKIILLFYIIVMSDYRLLRMFTMYFTIVLSQKWGSGWLYLKRCLIQFVRNYSLNQISLSVPYFSLVRMRNNWFARGLMSILHRRTFINALLIDLRQLLT